MVNVCTEYLRGKIIAAMGNDFMGDAPQIFASLKELENCVDVRCAGILIRSDELTFSGRPRRNTATSENDLCLYDRVLTVDVIIGEEDKAKLDSIFSAFVAALGRGFTDEGHYIAIEIGEAEWVDKKDSILNANIAVELQVKFRGGIYKAITYKQLDDIQIGKDEP